jgi:ribonuclease E
MARRRRGSLKSSGTRKLLINASESEECRIAILKDGKLDEYYIERQSLGSTLGNIYKARITNVEKSIGAAFVEFGHTRQGFLHVSDLSMEAVGADAAELLINVQAAREVAHDEDVVESEDKAAEKSSKEPAAAAVAAAAESDALPEAADAASAVAAIDAPAVLEPATRTGLSGSDEPVGSGQTPEPEAEAGEFDDDAESDYSPDEVIDPWTGDPVEGDDRGSEVHEVQDADVDDEELPELELELIEPDDEEEQDEAGDDTSDDAGEDDSEDAEQQLSADDEPAPDDQLGAADDAGASDAVAEPTNGELTDSDVAAQLELFGPLDEGLEKARLQAEQALPERGGRRRGRRGRGGRRRGRRSSEDNDQRNESSESSNDRNGKEHGRRGRKERSGSRGRSRQRDQRQMPAIEEILSKGKEIVVQVIKDGIGTKGPTLTTFLSIPGRYIVLMPGIRKRGVSRKVTDNQERDRLKDLVRDLEAPEEVGFIVRTAGQGCTVEDLQRDLDYLLRLWTQMHVRVKEFSAPVLLYQENDLVIRTLRDLYDGHGEVVIDDPATAEKAREFMMQIMPDCAEKVVSYKDEKPLFSHYGIETELQRLLQSRLELKSGASLVIEQTEALVAIDVNSGRYKPEHHKSIDDTAFAVNSEAAVEVARQLRLRDLGGVVVIDFIDMRLEKHRKALERLFKDELRKDRARIKVARVSPFGILEMTRQRVRPSLKRTVHHSCPYCEGTGYVPSDETSCLGVIRTIRDNLWRPGSVLVITVRPEVAEAVLNTQKSILAEIEKRHHRQVFIRADHRLAYDDIEVRAMVALPTEMDHRRA